MLDRREPADGPVRRNRTWLPIAWMTVLTVAVGLLVLDQTGVLDKLQSSTGAARIASALATFLVTALSAVTPAIIAELWIRRRDQRRTREQE